MLIILIILLTCLLVYEYKVNHSEVTSPPVLYIAPFVAMCIFAQAYSSNWNFDLSLSTFFVVLIGAIGFCIGNKFGKRFKVKANQVNDISVERKARSWKFLLFLVAQSICYIIKLRYIMTFTGTGDISKALVLYNNLIKFTTEDTIHFPAWLSLGLDISTMFGFICACLLAQQLLLKNRDKRNFILILVNFIVAVIGGSTSGGRGGSVQVMVSFLCAILILYQRKNSWKKTVSMKLIFMVGLGTVAILYLFVASIEWVGRYEVHNTGRYITNYIGAQIYNLNYLIDNKIEYSTILGQETFYPIIQKVCGWIGIPKWSNYHVGYPNVHAAGYSTGNVYTCYYSYLKDFGFLGVLFIPLLFGAFSQIIYKYARLSPYKYPINFGLVYYSNLAYMIAFSFFADKFGSIVLSPNMIKRVIILWLVNYFLFELDFKKSKIKYRNPFKNKKLHTFKVVNNANNRFLK